MTPAMAWAPPRAATAISIAAQASCASGCRPVAAPSSRREYRSITVARYSFPAAVGISVMSPTQRLFCVLALKSRRSRSGNFGAVLSCRVSPLRRLITRGDQALAAHRVGDRLLRHRPTGLAQVAHQPGRSVQPAPRLERLGHGLVDLGTTPLAGRRGAVDPLVEPGLRHPEQGAGDRVRHPVVGPLVGDEAGHAHFVASFTHPTTDRLRTSRSMRSSAFSARSRLSSSMSPADRPSVPFWASRARATQLPNVPSLTPRSRATAAIDFPVSSTIRTAPSRNSRSYFLRISGIATPYS